MASIVVCSYNIKYTVKPQTVQNAVCRLIRENPAISVIGLQEVGGRKHDELREIEGWRLIAPRVADGKPNPTPDPILVRRSDWTVKDSGAHRLNKVTKLPAGAPFGNERARFNVWAKLASKDGQGVWVVGNMHLMPGNNHDARHKAVYRTQVSNLMRWVRPRIDSRVVLLGDFNTLYGDAKNKPLRDEGLVSIHQVKRGMKPATHGGGRDIDHVWWYKAHNEVAWAKVLTGYPSDHKPLVVKLRSK